MTFYRAINRVKPSLIRTEADEATYNLHVMLRMEIEIALLEGTLAVKDLPEAWNSRMKDYLGVTPPDDAHGVLQDVHWSYGEMGYFPTYALGNLISAQLWESIHAENPDIEKLIEAGEFDALLGWLREKIHHHGRKFAPQELVNASRAPASMQPRICATSRPSTGPSTKGKCLSLPGPLRYSADTGGPCSRARLKTSTGDGHAGRRGSIRMRVDGDHGVVRELRQSRVWLRGRRPANGLW